MKKTRRSQTGEPPASRPYMPGYGIPKSRKGLLPWSHVATRMAEARHYWICTVDLDNHPHATPVDGVWIDDRLYFGGSPTTRRNRNLAANPSVCVHLDGSADVLILHGEARELHPPDPALIPRLIEASSQKYGYAPRPEDYASGVFVFRPRVVFAWTQGLSDATRWSIPRVSS